MPYTHPASQASHDTNARRSGREAHVFGLPVSHHTDKLSHEFGKKMEKEGRVCEQKSDPVPPGRSACAVRRRRLTMPRMVMIFWFGYTLRSLLHILTYDPRSICSLGIRVLTACPNRCLTVLLAFRSRALWFSQLAYILGHLPA